MLTDAQLPEPDSFPFYGNYTDHALGRFTIRVHQELRYASWDIAVTPEGPVMIEGNWDAEFYAEQMLYGRGNRSLFVNKLEGKTYD